MARRPIVALGLLVLGLVAGSWLLWLLAETLLGDVSLEALESWVEAAGPWAPVASVALMVVHTVVPFPAELLAAANGMAFGAIPGTLVTWLGGLAGAASGYAVGWLFERWLAGGLGYGESLARIRHLVERHGTAGLVAVRLLPVIPFNVVDYAAGMLRLSWWTFGWTTAIGIIPWSVLLTVGGTQLLGALQGEVVAIGILAGITVLLVLSTWIGRRWTRRPTPSGELLGAGHPLSKAAGGDTARIAIPDMQCAACAQIVGQRLRAVPGVRQVRVELDGRVVEIAFDRQRTSVGSLLAAVRQAGFTAESTKR